MAVLKEEIEVLKTKKRSVLYPYLDDIRSLREANVSLRGIQIWIKEQSVETSMENIRLFCKRNKIFILNKAEEKSKKSAHDIYTHEEKAGSKISFLSEE